MNIVRKLADEIGVRYGGSREEAEAAEYIKSCFEQLGLEVNVQKAQILSWNSPWPPEVQILVPKKVKLEAAPMVYTASTPEKGICGRLVKIGKHAQSPGVREFEWVKYGILSQEGDYIGHIIARPNGPAIPVINHSRGMPYSTPTAIIGKEDKERIDSLLASGGEVIVKLRTKASYQPSKYIQSVIATLPGKLSKSIIISAHHDSPFGSPGAVDNASGVETIFRLAKELKGSNPEYSIKFISFGGEEPYLLGARYYVRDLKERGLLGTILLNINLDSVGIEENIKIYCGPEGLKKNVQYLFESHHAFEEKKVEYDLPKAITDDYAFAEEGIPTILFMYWPYPQYHLPSDTSDIVQEKSMEDTVSRIKLLLGNLDTLFLKRI